MNFEIYNKSTFTESYSYDKDGYSVDFCVNYQLKKLIYIDVTIDEDSKAEIKNIMIEAFNFANELINNYEVQ
jgi:hypothetical protein